MKIIKNSAGCYTATSVAASNIKVEITCDDWLSGPDKWMARAGWDKFILTDPLPTFKEARKAALEMIEFRTQLNGETK